MQIIQMMVCHRRKQTWILRWWVILLEFKGCTWAHRCPQNAEPKMPRRSGKVPKLCRDCYSAGRSKLIFDGASTARHMPVDAFILGAKSLTPVAVPIFQWFPHSIHNLSLVLLPSFPSLTLSTCFYSYSQPFLESLTFSAFIPSFQDKKIISRCKFSLSPNWSSFMPFFPLPSPPTFITGVNHAMSAVSCVLSNQFILVIVLVD